MDIYSVIFEYCKQKGISVRELERQCAFPQGSIRRWVSVSPGIDKVSKVADVLGCTIDELCGRAAPAESHDDHLVSDFINELRPVNDLSEDEQLIIHKFRTLPDADKVKLLFQIMRFEAKRDE